MEAPPAFVAASAIATYFGFIDMGTQEILEARQAIEQMTVKLAAERIDEHGIAELRALIEAADMNLMDDYRLHIALAVATGNAALVIFVAALTRTSGGRIDADALQVGSAEGDNAVVLMRRAHRAIAEAVIAGDVARAQRAMSTHLRAAFALLQEQQAGGVAAAGWSETSDRHADQDERSPKLAARVAAAMKADFAGLGTQPGESVASEGELIERYGVSRGVLREAIRILEHNGIASMKKGWGGGLVVGQGDSSRALDVVCNYLLFAGLGRNVIFDARSAVELTTVALAADGIDERGAAILREALENEQSLEHGAPEAVHDIHVIIAELAGNRALAFFARILIRLTMMLVPDVEAVPAANRSVVRHVHSQIAESIITGDSSLARHRMLRHLEALAPWIGLQSESLERRATDRR